MRSCISTSTEIFCNIVDITEDSNVNLTLVVIRLEDFACLMTIHYLVIMAGTEDMEYGAWGWGRGFGGGWDRHRWGDKSVLKLQFHWIGRRILRRVIKSACAPAPLFAM